MEKQKEETVKEILEKGTFIPENIKEGVELMLEMVYIKGQMSGLEEGRKIGLEVLESLKNK